MDCTFMEGKPEKEHRSACKSAAPVGVTNSPLIPDEYSDICFRRASVAGAGTGNSPCAHRTLPPPTFNGEQTNCSTLSAWQPTAAQATSTIVSTAPTS